ncbi:coilin-like isoform X1, partial [Elysia marginata]
MAAPCEHENVRVRVSFTTAKDLCKIKLAQRWSLIYLVKYPTIKDVENKIISDVSRELEHSSHDQQTKSVSDFTLDLDLDLDRSRDPLVEQERSKKSSQRHPILPQLCHIWLNGFWLPSYESTRILRDGDNITVYLKARGCSGALSSTQRFDHRMAEDKKDNNKRKRNSLTQVDHSEGQNETVLPEGKSSKSKKRKKTSEQPTPQEDKGLHHKEKKKRKEYRTCKASSSESTADGMGNLEGNSSITSKETTYEQKSKKKQKNKSLEKGVPQSCEAIGQENLPLHSASKKMEMGVNKSDHKTSKDSSSLEPASPWSEDGRKYLESLISDRIGELSSISAHQSSEAEKMAQSEANGNSVMTKLGGKYYKILSRPTTEIEKLCTETCSQSDIHIPGNFSDHSDSQQALQQESEGHFYHMKIGPSPAAPQNPLEFLVNGTPETPNSLLSPHTPGSGVTKKRRRRKKKSNRNAEVNNQTKSSVQPHTEAERDYRLRLPNHLQPPQNNRLLFDDDDDEDVEEKKILCEKADDLDSLKPSMVQKLPKDTLPVKPSNEHKVTVGLLSKHRKLAVSAVFENLRNQVGINRHNGHTNNSNESTDQGCKVKTSQDVTFTHKLAPKEVQSKPKRTNFVSADDKFASLLGNTKRQPANVQISPAVMSRHAAESPDARNTANHSPTVSRPKSTEPSQMRLKAADQAMTTKVDEPPGPNTTVVAENSQRKLPSLPSRQDLEEGLKPWPEVEWQSFSQNVSLQNLTELPKSGDILVYKILELSDDYTPVLSDYKKALVLEVNTSSSSTQLELLMSDAEKKRQGRFELDDESETSQGGIVGDSRDVGRFL